MFIKYLQKITIKFCNLYSGIKLHNNQTKLFLIVINLIQNNQLRKICYYKYRHLYFIKTSVNKLTNLSADN